MTGRAAACRLAVLVLALAGCTTAPAPSVPDAHALAAALNSSLGGHDRAAFLTSFADTPHARGTGALWFDNLEQLQSVSFSSGEDGRLDVVWTVPGDTAPARHTLSPVLAGQDGRTVVTTVPQSTFSPLWSIEPVTVLSGGSGTIVAASSVAVADRIGWSSRLDAAAEAVRKARLGPLAARWRGGLVVELPGSPLEFHAVTGTTASGSAAVTHREGDAIRVVVNPELPHLVDAAFLDALAAHEATHVATRTIEAEDAPRWVSEGLAEWVAVQADPEAARESRRVAWDSLRNDRLPTHLPTAADLDDAHSATASYALAQIAVESVVKRLGRSEAMVFLERLVGGQPGERAHGEEQAARWYAAALADLAASP